MNTKNKLSMKLNQSKNKIKYISLNKKIKENNLIDKTIKNDELINKIAVKNKKLKNEKNIIYKDNNNIKKYNFNINTINYNLGRIKNKEIDIKNEKLIKKITLNKLNIYF